MTGNDINILVLFLLLLFYYICSAEFSSGWKLSASKNILQHVYQKLTMQLPKYESAKVVQHRHRK